MNTIKKDEVEIHIGGNIVEYLGVQLIEEMKRQAQHHINQQDENA